LEFFTKKNGGFSSKTTLDYQSPQDADTISMLALPEQTKLLQIKAVNMSSKITWEHI
jgi:hypothetical protein